LNTSSAAWAQAALMDARSDERIPKSLRGTPSTRSFLTTDATEAIATYADTLHAP
jgi:hypothetical protein